MCQAADDGVLDGAECLLVAASGSESFVLRGEVGVVVVRGSECALLEGPVQPLQSLAGSAGALSAGGLVVAGALSGPGREVLGGRERAHFGTDLRDHCLCAAPLNAGDRAEQLNGFLERADLLSNRVGETVDLLIQEVDVGEDRTDPESVEVIKAALQSLFEGGQLGAQSAFSEVCEYLGVGGGADQRVEHRAPRLAENVRRDTVELH